MPHRRQTLPLLLIALAVVAGVTAGDVRARAENAGALFVPAPATMPGIRSDQLKAIRQRPTSAAVDVVRVNLNALAGGSVEIRLPGGGLASASRRSIARRGDNDFTWTGEFRDQPGTAILVVKDGEVTGQIQRGLNSYEVTPIGGGAHAVIRIDQRRFPPDHPGVARRGG